MECPSYWEHKPKFSNCCTVVGQPLLVVNRKIMKRTKQQAEVVAQKLTRIFEAVESITDEDVKYLGETIQIIQDDRGKQQALGMMFDPTKAQAMIRLGEQAENRIKGVLMIREALDETWQTNMDYAKGRIAEEKTKETFGL
jgi:hypothetical protein